MKVEVKKIGPDEEENAVIRVAELTDSGADGRQNHDVPDRPDLLY